MYEEVLKLDSFTCFSTDPELSKMILRDFGEEAFVSSNIHYQHHQFMMRGLGDMSSDGQTIGHTDRRMDGWTIQQQHALLNILGEA
jgi:hypothetical protein